MTIPGRTSDLPSGDEVRDATQQGLDDARATMAELWRRHTDDALRAQAMRALESIISAEAAMKAADAFVAAKTPKQRRDAFEQLRRACIRRTGLSIREKP